jgi:YHS domain-containing protein
MKITNISPGELKDSWWISTRVRQTVARDGSEACNDQYGLGWTVNGGDSDWWCAGRCGTAWWVKCKRDYQNLPGSYTIPDDTVRVFSGVEGTKARNAPAHYQDFKLGEYGNLGNFSAKITSVAVPLGLKLTLYDDDNFKGGSQEILGSFPSTYTGSAEGGTLININNVWTAKSLKVEKDCTDSRHTFDPSCDQTANVPGSLVFNARKTFCNASIDNAYSDNCVKNWCKSNSTECTLLNAKQDCIKYGFCMDSDPKLCSERCTGEEIAKLQAQCEKSGLKSEQGTTYYGCTKESLETFYKDCKDFGLTKDVCTSIELQNAKTNQFNADQLALAKTGQQTSQANYQQTRDTIMSVLTGEPVAGGTGESVAESGGVADLFSDPTVLMIAGVVGILLICSSSSSLLLLSKKSN